MRNYIELLLTSTTSAVLGLCALLGASRLDAQTLTVTTLHRFSTSDGTNPYYGFTQGPDGSLYGTCVGVELDGGAGGTVIKFNPSNTNFSVLHTFNATDSESAYNTGGANPLDGPLLATDGLLYGCTEEGGTGAYGVIYSMTTNGDNYTLVTQFNGSDNDVEYQSGGIVQGSDGFLYGEGESEGTEDGQIYKIDTNGGNYANLTYFSYTSGGYNYNALLPGRNGNLYGVTGGDTQDGDPNNVGTVFMLTTGGTYTVLHNLAGNDGQLPDAGLIEDTSGSLYGSAAKGGTEGDGTIFRIGTNGMNFTVLHQFGSITDDGTIPVGRLLLASDGDLYGATLEGGTNGFGTIFRMSTNGDNYQELYSFTGNVGASGDHGYPNGCLIEAGDGLIYGMTSDIDYDFDPAIGNGSIFELNAIAPAGTSLESINRVFASPTNLTSVQWTVTFAAAVSGVNATNFQLASIGLTGSPAITSVSGSGTNWIVTASTGSGTGTLQLNLTNASGISPAVTNSLPYSGQSYVIDLVPPTISIGSPSPSITASGAISYTVTYADTNFNASTLADGDITLNTSGTANAGSISVSGSGTTRTVTLSDITGDGTLGISIAAGTASDTAGNLAPAAGPSATATADNTPPTVSISSPSVPIASSGPVGFTVTWSDANLNSSSISLSAGQVIVNTSGTVTYGFVSVSGTGNSRTVELGILGGDGTVGISIPTGTASDYAGNPAGAGGPSALAAVDNTPPTVSISVPTPAATTNGPTSSVSYTVAYTDANFNAATLSAGNISLTNSAVTATVSVMENTASNFTVTLSDLAGVGSQAIEIAAGTATDLAGNMAAATGPSASFIVSNAVAPAGPSIVISSPTPMTTVAGPVAYTVTYADPNFSSASLVAGDISLNTLGSATGAIGSVVSGSSSATGASYTVTLNNISGSGSLGISIAAGTASNSLGGVSAAAGPSYAVVVDLWQFDSLYSFTNGSDGNIPQGGLTLAPDGNFYGVSLESGDGSSGTIYKVGASGALSVLHSFTGADDGGTPYAGLTLASDGLLYGTASMGGTNGGGTIFQISTNGDFQVLNDFASSGVNGWIPNAPLIQGADGYLYGTTSQGGENIAGNIFRISTNGVLTNFYSFSGPDGDAPMAPLFQATDGNFYGTASMGGSNNQGTIFQITPGGTLASLYSFSAAPSLTNEDGTQPIGGLVQGRDGGLYGVTSGGGPYNGGTVFRITTGGTFSVIHALNPNLDGDDSTASLILGSDGNLYGTTQFGSPAGNGSVFQVTTNGTLTVLYSFVGGSFGDGAGVTAPVLQGPNGNLFGAATQSGHGLPDGAGAIFELINPNPPPLIVAQPTNVMVAFGSDDSLSVSATSASPLTFQWAFDGTNIDAATNATLTLTNVNFGQAGSYSVEIGNSNALIESATAILIVTQAEAAMTLDGLDQTYDGTAKNVTATTEPEGLTVDITYDGSTNAPTNAGSYSVVGTIDDLDYEGSVTNTLVVSNAMLVAVADNASRYVDQPNPVFTGSLVGAVDSDELSLSFGTLATSGSPPGGYAIVPVINDPNNHLSNYDVTITNGTLTVTLGEPTITLGTNSIFYTLAQGPALLAPGAQFAAASSPSFSDGHLTVQITSNAAPLDLLFVQNAGIAPGQISVAAGTIAYGGLDIASYVGGTTNDPLLQFTFNVNADVAGIQALIQSLTFSIDDFDSTNLSRRIELTLDDGNSLTSAPVSLTIIINHRPVALPFHVATGTNVPLAINFARLLTNCFDIDGDPITITEVESNSAAGGAVTTNATGLNYMPATNFAGPDQFNYFISDGRTGTNTGVVYVLVLTGSSLAVMDSLTNAAPASQIGNLAIEGIAERTYRLEASDDLFSWIQIGAVTMPDDGFTNYFDTNAINHTNRFYRTVYP